MADTSNTENKNKYLDENGLRHLVENLGGGGGNDMEPLTNDEIKEIMDSEGWVGGGGSGGGIGSADIAEHDASQTAHPYIRDLITIADDKADEAKSTADTAKSTANAAKSTADGVKEIADNAYNIAQDALSFAMGSKGFTPFRVVIPRSPTSASKPDTAFATVGEWITLGKWKLATCYASNDIQVAGIYNDDIIQIYGIQRIGGGDLEEYLKTPPIVIERSDGIPPENFVTDNGVGTIFMSTYESGSNKRYMGTVTCNCWRGKIQDIERYFLDVGLAGAICLEDGSGYVNDQNSKYEISRIITNFSMCRSDILKITPDTVS